MKIVFLDFDGVLVNSRSWHVRSGLHATADPPCVSALNRITETTGAFIVVSSTWRIGTSLVELRDILKSWGVTGTVLDRTPFSGKYGEVRGKEIAAWIETYPRPTESFVILDDDTDMNGLRHHLVQTDFNEGLTEKHADDAIQMLSSYSHQTQLRRSSRLAT